MGVQIYSVSQYIESKCNLESKIKAIDNLISAMELKLLDVSASVAYDEYNMDDGQMKVRAKYRSSSDVLAGITAMEALKQRYVNRFNGRATVFRGGKFC